MPRSNSLRVRRRRVLREASPRLTSRPRFRKSSMEIVAEPGEAGQPLQHKCCGLVLSANRRSWATQLIDSIGCVGAKRVDLSFSRGRRGRAVLLIGADDGADQFVPNDVAFGEID